MGGQAARSQAIRRGIGFAGEYPGSGSPRMWEGFAIPYI